jgi:hypothetical protein
MSAGQGARKPRRRNPSLGRVFFEDLRRTRFSRDYWKEIKELYYFFLDEDSRNRLANMGRLRRAVSMLGCYSRA